MNENLKCEVCGGISFVEGKLSGYAKVMPVGRMGFGSDLILTACKDCGEVVSMKVKNPHKLE